MAQLNLGRYGVVDIPDAYAEPSPVRQSELAHAPAQPAEGPSVGDYARSITGNFVRGVTEQTARTAEGIAGFQRGWLPWSPEISNRALEVAGGVIRSTGEAIAPARVPELEGAWYNQLASGLGSTVPFIAGGLTAGAAKLPAWLSASLSGFGAGAKSMFDDARAHGATPEEARWSLLYGGITGTSEGLGAGRILDRIDKASGGSLWKFLMRVGGDTAEEALQNAGQQLATDVGAKNIFGYDKDRELLPDFLKAAALGGGVGLIASTLLNALGIPIRRAQERSNLRRGEQVRRAVISDAVDRGLIFNEGGPNATTSRASSQAVEVPDALQGAINRGTGNIEDVGNFVDAVFLSPESFALLPVGLKRVMQSGVLGVAANDGNIARSIVSLVPVNVVNNLSWKQFTSEFLLGNPSVLLDVLAANPDASIWPSVINGLVSDKTFPRAEWISNITKAANGSVDTTSAVGALNNESSIHVAQSQFQGSVSQVVPALQNAQTGQSVPPVLPIPAPDASGQEAGRVVVPTPLGVQNAITAGTTVNEVLRRITQDKTNKYSDLAGELLAIGDDAGLSVPIKLRDAQSDRIDPPPPGKSRSFYLPRAYKGAYKGLPEHIAIHRLHSNDTEIVIHEIIHALTSEKVGRAVFGKLPQGSAVGGAEYGKLIDRAILDKATPESVREILNLYLKARKDRTIENAQDYGFTNVNEFLAEAFSNPKFREVLRAMPSDVAGQSVWQRLVDAVRKILGLAQGRETLLDEVIRAGAQLISEPRPATPTAEAPLGSPDFSPPEPSTLNVPGSVSQVGRVADSIYEQREKAAQALDGLAYERQQFKAARSKLKELADLAYGRLIATGDEEGIAAPDPGKGITIQEDKVVVDDAFVNSLTVNDVDHDVAQVKAMQGEIFFEQAAKRLNNIYAQIDVLQQAVGYYQKFHVEQSEIATINKSIASLSDEATKLGNATFEDRPILQRANEITSAEGLRQNRLAQRDALSLDPVAQFFGPTVGSFRDFKLKIDGAIKLAEALKNNAPPDEVSRLTKEIADWVNLPTTLRNAMLHGGQPLSADERARAFADLRKVFYSYDTAKVDMDVLQTNRGQAITKEIPKLLDEIADAKIKSGMAEVMMSDVLSALGGDNGGTGTLQSQAKAQELKGLLSAIQMFAEKLGENIETNQALFHWLANPTWQSEFLVSNAEAFNVSPAVLKLILAEVQRSPAFGSAIVTLVQASNKKLAKLPIVQLEQIRTLLQEGKADEAKALANKVLARSKANASMAEASHKENLSKLDALEIEQQSLAEGASMFTELGNDPDFKALRDAIENSKYGGVEEMVVENNTSSTFLPFGKTLKPEVQSWSQGAIKSNDGFVSSSADDPSKKGKARNKILAWLNAAEAHVVAYEVAAKAYADGGPSPTELGFDLPQVRGLRDAVERYVLSRYLDPTLLEESQRYKIPLTVRAFMKTGMFRQHTFVTRMVGGQAGFQMRGSFGDYVNHKLIAQSIGRDYQDVAEKRYQALMSHPELNGNMTEYRKIWNEMGHEGRQFPTPLKIGYVLPRSGIKVSEADMVFLKREHQYEESLRRRVAETTPVSGIVEKVGDRKLVRSSAAVGVYGMPRYPGQNTSGFISDVTSAYGENDGFTPLSDLSTSSTDPIVAYWNSNIDLVIEHIMDIGRNDRVMRIGGLMRQAETNADKAWRDSGRPHPQSLDELITLLVTFFPSSAGLNVRDHVVNGLNSELRQYRDAAQRLLTERSEAEKATHTQVEIAISASNEFTRPAAQLELPSRFYNYGALTAGEHQGAAERANHERAVAYATSVQRAIGDLRQREQDYGSGKVTDQELLKSYGGSIQQMQQTLAVLELILDDFKAAGRFKNPATGIGGFIRDAFNTLVASVLALPIVNLRNLTQGQFETYVMARAMGLAGHRLNIMRASWNMVKGITRYALHAGTAVAKASDLGLSVLTRSNIKVFESMISSFTEAIFGSDARLELVRDLGFDTREKFRDRFKTILREGTVHSDLADLQHAATTSGKIGRGGKIAIRTLQAAFERIGVQESDLIINANNLAFTHNLQRRLGQVAIVYGKAREGLGTFDLNDSRFLLQPHEWASFASKQENADSLAQIRLLFEGAAAEGFQLEKALYDYYQAIKKGKKPTFFTDRQFYAVQRAMLAEFNASTPGNRASAAYGNSVLRALLKLHGYPADGMMKLFNVFGGARSRTKMAALMVQLPLLAMLAFMAVIIGYFVSSLTGLFDKKVQGRITAKPTPLDADFWDGFKQWGLGTLRVSAAQLFYVGELILWARGEVQGNRGFDPAGRVFGVSVANRFYSTIVGAVHTKGTIGQHLVPFADLGGSMVPWFAAVQNMLVASQSKMKQGERVIRGDADTEGLLPKKGISSLGPSYGPTTIIRRQLGDAVSEYWEASQAGNTARAEAAFARAQAQLAQLRNFYLEKYAGDPDAYKKAETDIWRDYQELNPAVAGMLGKRPTAGEWQLLHGRMSGDRLQVVNDAVAAWQAGAMALFGKEGQVTREDVAASRRGGGGGNFLGMPSIFAAAQTQSALPPRLNVFRPSTRGSLRRSLRSRGLRRRRLSRSRVLRQPRLAGRSRNTRSVRRIRYA